MRKILGIFACIFISSTLLAQEGTVAGVVSDKITGETLIGAAVIYEAGKGVTTDIDGKYSITLPYGTYTFKSSYVGYKEVEKTITVEKKYIEINFVMGTTQLREIEIVADMAVENETPVAFTNLKPVRITQELGTNDIPMLLAATPGVYATPAGGSDGGARISIRGFDQRNISVMIDGIPINNMDDGRVFWSNTYGLDAVLANLQVQRGLTSSKLALPAIGGTINYITKSIENKQKLFFQQSYGSYNTLRSTIGYNSGRLKKGWGFSLAGSLRKGDGFYDKQFKEEYFYYGKVQKDFGNHIVSFTASGSPIRQGIRANKNKITVYDREYARGLFTGSDELYNRYAEFNVISNLAGENNQDAIAQRDKLSLENGWGDYNPDTGEWEYDREQYLDEVSQYDFIDTTGVVAKGVRYNNHWGYLDGNAKSERLRDYHKPIFVLSDFWSVSKRVSMSNKLYYSFGKGGVTNRIPYIGFGDYDDNLQVDFQDDWNNNTVGGIFGPPIDPLYSDTELKSTVIMRKVYDNHQWFGWLGIVDFNMNETWSFAGGLDFRYYKSQRYAEISDLLGGDYYVPELNSLPQDRPTDPQNRMYRVGDKYDFNSENFIRWGAFFGEAKYSKEKWTAFLNLSGVVSGYKRIDYFGNKDFIANDDERFANAIGHGDVLFYNGSNVLVAADNLVPGSSSYYTSGDTTYVTNPSENYNDYAPTGESYIVGAEQVEYEDDRNQTSETPWKNIPGFTIKGGLGYKFNDNHHAYVNLGYLSRTPRFSNVVDISNLNQFFRDIENEKITSFELGYSYTSGKFAAVLSGYYIDWKNRPYQGGVRVKLPGRDITVQANVNAMNAVHMGLEATFKYNFSKNWSAEAFTSLGDWRWTSKKDVNFFDDNGNIILEDNGSGEPLTISFDADGVFVGNSPQTQVGGSLRYMFLKEERAYLGARYTYYARHYSQFDPLQLTGEKEGRQSWMLPNFGLMSVYAGYHFDISKVRLDINLVVDNVLNQLYISDGDNNSGQALVTTDYLNSPAPASVTFDANSTAVYFGLPTTFGITLKATL